MPICAIRWRIDLTRFFGIVIKMFTDDHNLPHFHAFDAEHEALIDIQNLSIFAGKLPPRAERLPLDSKGYIEGFHRYAGLG